MFKQYSSIESVTRTDKDDVEIVFDEVGDLNRLANISRMKIGSHRVQIKLLHLDYKKRWFFKVHVAETLPNPPDQDSPLHILNALNDDCLFQIFESDELGLTDLGAIGSVCKRFNRITNRIFQRKYNSTTGDNCDLYMLCHLYDHFHCFASTITSIDLSGLDHLDRQPVAFGMIVEHCKHVVSLTCDVVDRSGFTDLRQLSAYLKELHVNFHMVRVTSRDLDLILGENSSLEILELFSSKVIPVHLPTVILPQLIDLRLAHIRGVFSVGDFFKKHNHLKKLAINDAFFDFKVSDEPFVDLTNLEEFSYTWSKNIMK